MPAGVVLLGRLGPVFRWFEARSAGLSDSTLHQLLTVDRRMLGAHQSRALPPGRLPSPSMVTSSAARRSTPAARGRASAAVTGASEETGRSRYFALQRPARRLTETDQRAPNHQRLLEAEYRSPLASTHTRASLLQHGGHGEAQRTRSEHCVTSAGCGGVAR